MINKHAQAGPVAFVIGIVFFVILLFIWIAPYFQTVTHAAVTENHLTGIEAWSLDNIVIFIFISVILGTVGFVYFFGRAGA